MQKIVALVTVLLIGGGAYIYFYNPELKETITDSVSKMMSGSSMQNVSAYEKDLKKEETSYLARMGSLNCDIGFYQSRPWSSRKDGKLQHPCCIALMEQRIR